MLARPPGCSTGRFCRWPERRARAGAGRSMPDARAHLCPIGKSRPAEPPPAGHGPYAGAQLVAGILQGARGAGPQPNAMFRCQWPVRLYRARVLAGSARHLAAMVQIRKSPDPGGCAAQQVHDAVCRSGGTAMGDAWQLRPKAGNLFQGHPHPVGTACAFPTWMPSHASRG